jgi:flagellar protein FliO/FliZ
VSGASTAALVARSVLSLVVVFALMALAARMVRKRGLGGTSGAAGARIEVLARHGLGRTSSVAVVKVAGRTLVLGVTDAHVSVLAEADPALVEAEAALAADSRTKHRPRATDRPARTEFPSLMEWLRDLTMRS